jgi:hypothetical protein
MLDTIHCTGLGKKSWEKKYATLKSMLQNSLRSERNMKKLVRSGESLI